MEDGCDFVFILKSDMQLEENCIESLQTKILSDENIGLIGPILLYGYQSCNIIQGYGVNANF